MLVIRLYKCTGKEVPEIDGFRWLEKKKQIRALETLVDTKYEKCIALPLTIHIRKKMPWM